VPLLGSSTSELFYLEVTRGHHFFHELKAHTLHPSKSMGSAAFAKAKSKIAPTEKSKRTSLNIQNRKPNDRASQNRKPNSRHSRAPLGPSLIGQGLSRSGSATKSEEAMISLNWLQEKELSLEHVVSENPASDIPTVSSDLAPYFHAHIHSNYPQQASTKDQGNSHQHSRGRLGYSLLPEHTEEGSVVQCAIIPDQHAADITQMYREFVHVFPKPEDLEFVLANDLAQSCDYDRDEFQFPSEKISTQAKTAWPSTYNASSTLRPAVMHDFHMRDFVEFCCQRLSAAL
jgi:hypothetical protein